MANFDSIYCGYIPLRKGASRHNKYHSNIVASIVDENSSTVPVNLNHITKIMV